jgi:hypothetical protein
LIFDDFANYSSLFSLDENDLKEDEKDNNPYTVSSVSTFKDSPIIVVSLFRKCWQFFLFFSIKT